MTHDSLPVRDAVARACARIAPTWPLDRFIAVNPFWGMVHQPLTDVASSLRSASGARLMMPRAWYRDAYARGELTDEHLRAAAASASADGATTASELRALLDEEEPETHVRARLFDVVDADRDTEREESWRSFITHTVSQFCAAYFDEGQAQFRLPRNGDEGLYGAWRRHAEDDRTPELRMGARTYRSTARTLPRAAHDLIEVAVAELELAPEEREFYLWSLLLEQNGWASWCAYRGWTARLRGETDDCLEELLAIRLAWELVLLRASDASVRRRWQHAMAAWKAVDEHAKHARRRDVLLQDATEAAWRAPLLHGLAAGLGAQRPDAPSMQAVFCIDVRSEPFRRALEGTHASVQTLGFAGFFGIPLAYQSVASAESRPQLPGLLAPQLFTHDEGMNAQARMERERYFDLSRSWKSFRGDALGAFTFVEAMGLTYAASLLRETLGRAPELPVDVRGLPPKARAMRRVKSLTSPSGEPLDVTARAELACRMLRGMSLTRNFARAVLLLGHGSSSRNNPHAAGLDCGACCGQTGEVNARVAAALLNDAPTRAAMRTLGIDVPSTTWFVAGLHDTATDDVELYDVDDVPPSHASDVEAARAGLARAAEVARAQRAPRVGVESNSPGLATRMRKRAWNWAQTRPEWGLAGNAAFIAAPREHCRDLDLGGRVFLHEYRHREDTSFDVLELIMTAPMVVAHWINFQYYASTVDNDRYGSGNKVLHNVVGGHLGVFEGNGGDLRIGLPLQSLHDGAQWIHVPLRLSVFLEAPRDAIDAILQKHAHVRALVENGWLSLFQLDDADLAVYARRSGTWVRCDCSTENGVAA